MVFAPPKIKGELADFVTLVTDKDMFKESLATMGVDTSKMPLGDISQRTIDEGFRSLLAVEAYLKKGGGPQLATLCSAFYTYIPHAFGRKAAPLLTLADIQVCPRRRGGSPLLAPAVLRAPSLTLWHSCPPRRAPALGGGTGQKGHAQRAL